MPTLSKSLPKYRRHRASGQALVTLCGVDHYLGPHGTKASKREYDRLVAEWLQNGRQLRPAEGEPITVVELIAAYIRHAKAYYQKGGRPTSEYTGIVFAVRILKELYGQQPVTEFGPLCLQTVRQRMIDAGHSRGVINQSVSRIRRMFKWAAGEELIPASIAQALSMVAGLRQGRSEARETSPVLPVDDAVVEATLPHLPEVVGDMVRLQRVTGMRPAEVRIMRPRDIDRQGDVWAYRPPVHKTEHHGHTRTVFIGPKAQAVLLRYLARDVDAYCFRPCDSEKKRRSAAHEARVTPLVCGNRPGTNRSGKPKRPAGESYTMSSYMRAIHRGCDKAFVHPVLGQIPAAKLTDAQRCELSKWRSEHRWSPNRLRHTCATEIRRRFGLDSAQAVLGHSELATTQIYAEIDATKASEVARRIG